MDLHYLEGKRFCIVFMNADDAESVNLRTLHGRASITREGALQVEHAGGAFLAPSSCHPQILPSDGTELLQDAEYYVICRVSGMDL